MTTVNLFKKKYFQISTHCINSWHSYNFILFKKKNLLNQFLLHIFIFLTSQFSLNILFMIFDEFFAIKEKIFLYFHDNTMNSSHTNVYLWTFTPKFVYETHMYNKSIQIDIEVQLAYISFVWIFVCLLKLKQILNRQWENRK